MQRIISNDGFPTGGCQKQLKHVKQLCVLALAMTMVIKHSFSTHLEQQRAKDFLYPVVSIYFKTYFVERCID